MTAPVKPRTRDDLTFVEIDGEAVVYDEVDDRLHYLNPTATLVFQLFDGSATIPELSQELAAASGLPEAQVERDVRTLNRQFRTNGLLSVNGGSSLA